MRRPGELVHRKHLLQAEASIDQDPGVASKASGVAGDANRQIQARPRDFGRLLLGSRPRGIEHHSIEWLQLGSRQWRVGEVATLSANPTGAAARSPRKSRQGRFVALYRMDPGRGRQRKRE